MPDIFFDNIVATPARLNKYRNILNHSVSKDMNSIVAGFDNNTLFVTQTTILEL